MYDGYPEIIRTNGLIISRTHLYGGEILECVQVDPNPPKTVTSPEPKKSDKTDIWASAREMRKVTELDDWYEALYLTVPMD